MKKVFKIIGYALLIGVVLLGAAFFLLDEKLPVGVKGEKAEALAQKMVQAVDKTAWDSTSYVSWTSRGGNTIVWDKHRNLAQVEWRNNKVLLDINKVSGKAWENQTEVIDATHAQERIQKAYKIFINDAFWLNPVVKIYDEGVTRSLVTLADGTEGLLVTYASGGITPGDSYLWLVDAQGLPTAWKMWVKVLPLGGIELSWEDWITLPTGAKVATMHIGRATGSKVPLTHVKAAAHLEELGLTEDLYMTIE
jgi:hypothetical protein